MTNGMMKTITRFAALCMVGSLLTIGAVTSASALTTTYNKPKWSGDRLDLCLHWGQGCGKPAADAFCQKKGFNTSAGYSIDHNIGATNRTRLITTGAVCDMNYCDGFKKVKCSN